MDMEIEKIDMNDDLETNWKKLHETANEVSMKVLGSRKKTKFDWYDENDEEIERLVEEKKKA